MDEIRSDSPDDQREGQMRTVRVEVEGEIAAMVARGDADFAAGRYVTITSEQESEARHEATMNRLRELLAQG